MHAVYLLGLVVMSEWICIQMLYQVTVKTAPNDGLYEATVRQSLQTGQYQLHTGDISRINRYGSQPDCIASQLPHLRPYCYCI